MAWRGWYPIGERFDDEGYSGATELDDAPQGFAASSNVQVAHAVPDEARHCTVCFPRAAATAILLDSERREAVPVGAAQPPLHSANHEDRCARFSTVSHGESAARGEWPVDRELS
jgi:hypothetical protein